LKDVTILGEFVTIGENAFGEDNRNNQLTKQSATNIAQAKHAVFAKKADEDKEKEEKRIAAFNKYIADHPNLYPAPFEGSWATIVQEYEYIPERTEWYQNPDTITYKRVEYRNYGIGGTYLGTETRLEEVRTPGTSGTRTIPAKITPQITWIYTFKGGNYTKTIVDNDQIEEKFYEYKGRFYYNGNNIELEDGTKLQIKNGILNDFENDYVKLKL